MLRDIHETSWGDIEAFSFLESWNTELTVLIPTELSEDYAERCIEDFDNAGDKFLTRFAKYAYRYFAEFKDNLFDDELESMKDLDETTVLKYVMPNCLSVCKEGDNGELQYHLELNCAWEEEHGMEISISDGRILYVGPFDDMAPDDPDRLEYVGYFDEESDFNMNYADKE